MFENRRQFVEDWSHRDETISRAKYWRTDKCGETRRSVRSTPTTMRTSFSPCDEKIYDRTPHADGRIPEWRHSHLESTRQRIRGHRLSQRGLSSPTDHAASAQGNARTRWAPTSVRQPPKSEPDSSEERATSEHTGKYPANTRRRPTHEPIT